MEFELQFLKALGLTVTIETAVLIVLVIFLKKYFSVKVEIVKTIFAGIFASSLTLPYLWFIVPAFIATNHGDYFFSIVLAEIAIWLVETVFYYFFLNIKFRYAILISFACNLFSYLFGLWLGKIFF